jgi:hypothetical protein
MANASAAARPQPLTATASSTASRRFGSNREVACGRKDQAALQQRRDEHNPPASRPDTCPPIDGLQAVRVAFLDEARKRPHTTVRSQWPFWGALAHPPDTLSALHGRPVGWQRPNAVRPRYDGVPVKTHLGTRLYISVEVNACFG